MGDVAVGCPKIWTADRIFSVLDGIVRDIDSMTIKALEGLDPNEANQAIIEAIQTSVDIQAKFDQSVAINNKAALENFNATHQSQLTDFKSFEANVQVLKSQRDTLTQKLIDAQTDEQEQIKAGANPNPTPATDQTTWSEADKKLNRTHNLAAAYSTQLDAINTKLNATPPTLGTPGTTAVSGVEAPGAKTAGALTLPPELIAAMKDKLANPKFPPTVQMDNVIDLLHERIAREFASMYDDLMRRSAQYDIYLVQFDVSLLPLRTAKDRNVRLKFNFSPTSDSECSIRAYDLYPNAAAYNIFRGFSKTTHFGLTGIAQTVFGFGIAATYQRDHTTLQSGLSQSLYATSFGAGLSEFGWEFAPNPNDNIIAPGPRLVYAIFMVNKGQSNPKNCAEIPLSSTIDVTWIPRDRQYSGWAWAPSESPTVTSEFDFKLPEQAASVKVDHVSYLPHLSYQQVSEDGQGNVPPVAEPAATDFVSIQARLGQKVDPGMIITANDSLLRRVRDERGRGLVRQSANAPPFVLAGSQTEQTSVANSRFGLLESDTVGPDTWYLTDSYTVIMNISKATAGTDRFPVIRFVNPSSTGDELTELSKKSGEVRVGDWRFMQPAGIPSTAFLPLFSKTYKSGQIKVYVEDVVDDPNDPDKGYPKSIRIVSQPVVNSKLAYLHDAAQVVLEAGIADGRERWVRDEQQSEYRKLLPNWALDCEQSRGELVCDMPLKWMRIVCEAPQTPEGDRTIKELSKTYDKSTNSIRTKLLRECFEDLKIWVNQPPFEARPGLHADDDLQPSCSPDVFIADAIPDAKYKVAEGLTGLWTAELGVRNISPLTTYQIRECEPVRSQSRTNDFREPICTVAVGPGQVGRDHKCVGKCRLNISGSYANLDALFPGTLTLVSTATVVSNNCVDIVDKPITIPPLQPQLLPGNLKVLATPKVVFIQGERLDSVVEVHLQKGEKADISISGKNLNRSARLLSFELPTKPAGTYSIVLAVGNPANPLPVPAVGNDQKPLTLTIAEPEKPAQNPSSSKPTLELKLDESVTSGLAVKVTVTARDAKGGTDTKFTGKVKFESSDKKATIPDETTFTVGEKGNNGVKDDFKVTFNTPGKQTLTVTSGSMQSKPASTIVK